MAIEPWAVFSALLFLGAAASSGLARFRVRGPWRRVAVAGRATGLVPLALALILAIGAHGEPSPFDLQQLGLALGLAVALIGLVRAWQLGGSGIAPVQDLVVLGLVLGATFAVRSGGSPLSCVQRSVLFWSQWFLFVLGSGSILLAGSAALDLALLAVLPGEGLRPARRDLGRLLADATFAALAILAGGLTISVWWAWRTGGGLSSGDPRQVWMAATWSVAAMSLLAWQVERQSRRLAAGLAVVAAAIALVGLLAVPDLLRLWWMGV